jgi:hypothetical protein
MLQPDLFFSYGLSAGLAVAAGKKLMNEESPWVNKYFIATILWLSVCFIPQVLYLLWRFPDWESMFVAKTFSDIPAWLLLIYPIAVIIMGTLGFHITFSFVKKKKSYAAIVQVIWSIAVALFMVTVGWDGTGYKRLLYAGTGDDWANGVVYPYIDFYKTPVCMSLLWLETFVLIPYFCLFIKWIKERQEL